MIAAIVATVAMSKLMIATRSAADFEALGVEEFNPFIFLKRKEYPKDYQYLQCIDTKIYND